jgi:hypothetical protein
MRTVYYRETGGEALPPIYWTVAQITVIRMLFGSGEDTFLTITLYAVSDGSSRANVT